MEKKKNVSFHLFKNTDKSETQSIRNSVHFALGSLSRTIINTPLLLKNIFYGVHNRSWWLYNSAEINACISWGAAGGERRKWDSSVQLYRDETFPRRFHEYLAFVLASSRFFLDYLFGHYTILYSSPYSTHFYHT